MLYYEISSIFDKKSQGKIEEKTFGHWYGKKSSLNEKNPAYQAVFTSAVQEKNHFWKKKVLLMWTFGLTGYWVNWVPPVHTYRQTYLYTSKLMPA